MPCISHSSIDECWPAWTCNVCQGAAYTLTLAMCGLARPYKIKRFTAYMNVCVASVWHGRMSVCVCARHMMQSNRQYEVHTCVKQVIPFWGFWIINATKNVRSSIYCCCVLNCILHCALVMGITAHFTHTGIHTYTHTHAHSLVRLMRLQSELILINCVASPISIKSSVIMWAEPD